MHRADGASDCTARATTKCLKTAGGRAHRLHPRHMEWPDCAVLSEIGSGRPLVSARHDECNPGNEEDPMNTRPSYEQRFQLLESCGTHLQTIAEVREHEAARAELELELDREREREAVAREIEREHERGREVVAPGRGALEPTAALGSRPTRVVVADDDGEIRSLLVAALRHGGHEVSLVSDGLELLTLLSAVSTHELEPPAAVISAVRMPFVTGIDALRNARSLGLDVPFILMTAFRDPRVAASAHELGASALFDKPFDVDLLLRSVDDAVARAA
jgi:two-component system, response regulator, stage 0 sporulation protein F